ncbi:hypothetical protein N7G274_002169 [Stereocaulon virgatum]|uniref:F-box domain-containing protein n=1 Tax=Stereocaulon virgatum TaxID=373712 RepID=A0ABR4AKW6_9LECA
MAPLLFNDLSYDIKKLILSYIIRPEDLKHLCLTSKQIRNIVTPQLYRKVLLFIGGEKDLRVPALLSRSNPGIQHIRKIYLQLEKTVLPSQIIQESSDESEDEEVEVRVEDVSGAARQAQFTVRLLLDFLPNDILETFSWQNWEPFSMDNWILLLKKQKRLKAIECACVNSPFMPVLEKHPELLKNLEGATSVHFFPDNLDRLQACQKILQSQPNITEMQLSSDRALAEGITDGLQDSSTRPGLISRTIFSHLMPFETCKPLVLKKLSIDNIDLRYAADTYMKFIKFSALESLVIGACTGADALFAQLSKPHLRPTKLHKLRWFHEETSEPHALEAFEGLLDALSGLKILHIDTHNIQGLPSASAIAHHGKTLQILGVRSRMPRPPILSYDSEQFDEICTNCLELRQLSVTFPPTSVSNATPSTEFKTYLRSCRKLRHLVTINFHDWPSTDSSFIGRSGKLKILWYDLYEHNLQRLAQQIFEASDINSAVQGWGLGNRSMLSVIAFGANGKTPYDERQHIRLKQVPFVRGTQTDAFGKTSMLAVKTMWKMVQFIEPESDVLNHSLYDLHDVHNSS